MLSSDLFEGRAPSTRGGKLAEEYLATQMAALGLQPAGDNGTFFQQVPIVESTVERNFALSVPGNTYRYFTDVVAFSGLEKPRVQVQGDVVFVGYGINAPELKWNDYAGVDVKGKWVMIMVNDPPAPADEPTLFGGPALTYYGRWTYKYEEAARQGAAGALLIHTDESATYPWQVVQTSWSGTQYSLPPRSGRAGARHQGVDHRDAAANDLAKRGGKDLDALRKSASAARLQGRAARRPRPRPRCSSARRARPPRTSIGVAEGHQRRSRPWSITAHWDHFGIRDPQPGDSQGRRPHLQRRVRQRVGVRRACSRSPRRWHARRRSPARSIYFVFVTGGGVGAARLRAFVAAIRRCRCDKVAANINIDEINYLGPTRDMVQLGVGALVARADARSACSRNAAARSTGDTHPERGYFFRSDHFPFAKAGVPALSIGEPKQFTGPNAAALLKKQEAYNDKDYHQPSDEYDPSWDFSGGVDDMQRAGAARLAHRAAPEMPKYNDGDQFANARK